MSLTFFKQIKLETNLEIITSVVLRCIDDDEEEDGE